MGFGGVSAVPPPPGYAKAPRFIVKVDRGQWSTSKCSFYILELVPGLEDTWRIPNHLRGNTVKRILKRIPSLDITGDNSPGIQAFKQAERVVDALNKMDLALQVAELDGTKGMKGLVEHLWVLEGEDDLS